MLRPLVVVCVAIVFGCRPDPSAVPASSVLTNPAHYVGRRVSFSVLVTSYRDGVAERRIAADCEPVYRLVLAHDHIAPAYLPGRYVCTGTVSEYAPAHTGAIDRPYCVTMTDCVLTPE